MDIFNQYMQSTPCTPDLDESRRAWLRDHPEWLIKGDSLECFLNSAEWDRQALAEFPGEFWLNINKYNEDFPVWISDIPGLVGVRLINCSIDDMNFIQFTKGANGLRHLILSGLNGVTDQGLRHISDLVNLESLKIYCYNHEAFDAAFLEGLSGDNSPLSLRIGGYKELSDAELEHISKWKRLSTCSLRVASNIRSDLPWLVGLKSLGCLHLDGNTPLIRQGIMRLAELPELRELKLDLDLVDAIGMDALAKLEKLENLSIRVKGGMHTDSHDICRDLALSKSIRKLDILVTNDESSLFNITTNDLKYFATMPQLKNLHILGGCEQTTNFGVLMNAPHLENIYLSGKSAPTDRDLAGLAKITGLNRLNMRVDECTSQGLATLAALPNLRELNLWGFEKQDESYLNCLTDFPALCKLTIGFNQNCNLGMRGLSFLKNIVNLESLTVYDRGEWNEVMINDIAAVTELKTLCLFSVWDLPGFLLKNLKLLPELEKIEFLYCFDLEDHDLDFLMEIKTLRKISFQSCDAITIKGLLRFRHLPLEEIMVSGIRYLTPVTQQEFMSLHLTWPKAIIS